VFSQTFFNGLLRKKPLLKKKPQNLNDREVWVEIGTYDITSGFDSKGSASDTFVAGNNTLDFTIGASGFSVSEGKYLAFKVTNLDPNRDLNIETKGEASWIFSPSTDPGYPVPELPTIILFSIGLLALAGYVVVRRKNK